MSPVIPTMLGCTSFCVAANDFVDCLQGSLSICPFILLSASLLSALLPSRRSTLLSALGSALRAALHTALRSSFLRCFSALFKLLLINRFLTRRFGNCGAIYLYSGALFSGLGSMILRRAGSSLKLPMAACPLSEQDAGAYDVSKVGAWSQEFVFACELGEKKSQSYGPRFFSQRLLSPSTNLTLPRNDAELLSFVRDRAVTHLLERHPQRKLTSCLVARVASNDAVNFMVSKRKGVRGLILQVHPALEQLH